MLLSLVGYAFLGEWLPHNVPTRGPTMLYALAGMSAALVGVLLLARRFTIAPAATLLAADPENRAALMRWRMGHVLTFYLCEAGGLDGLVLRFLGFTFRQAMPFYVVAILLLLYFAPRAPSNAIG